MRIFTVPDQVLNSSDGFTVTNLSAGVELSVRQCADKSGYIGKLMDFFTGDLIRNFFGDTPEVTVFAAETHVSKIEYWKVIA